MGRLSILSSALLLIAPVAVGQDRVDPSEVAEVLVEQPDHAGSEEGDADDPAVYVTPPTSPTRVLVGLSMQALDHVDPPSNASPHFVATYLLTARWSDPRLAFEPEPDGPERHVYQGVEAVEELRRIFWPDLTLENEDGARHVEGRTLTVARDGGVTYEEHFTSRFRARFDMLRFPFDTQRLPAVVQSMSWAVGDVVLAPDEAHTSIRNGGESTNLEWVPLGIEVESRERRPAEADAPHSQLVFTVTAERVPGFYLWKLVLPLLLIVAFTWTTFWMTGEASGTRMQRTFIALLSVVAFHRVISDHLPHIPDLTFMDAMVYLSFGFTGATMVQIVAAHRADQAGKKALSVELDVISRVAFPAVFLLALVALWIGYH